MSNNLSNLTSLRRTSLSDEAYDQLRRGIITGELESGAHLSEAGLSKTFGSSRAPVREAFFRLEKAGFIKSGSTGRCHVNPITNRDLEEIYQVRLQLEPYAAKLAATKVSSKDLVEMESMVDAIATSENLFELGELDLDLHERIVESSGNGLLASLWKELRPRIEWALYHVHEQVVETINEYAEKITLQSQRKFFREFQKGDPELAEKAMIRHIETWKEWWL